MRTREKSRLYHYGEIGKLFKNVALRIAHTRHVKRFSSEIRTRYIINIQFLLRFKILIYYNDKIWYHNLFCWIECDWPVDSPTEQDFALTDRIRKTFSNREENRCQFHWHRWLYPCEVMRSIGLWCHELDQSMLHGEFQFDHKCNLFIMHIVNGKKIGIIFARGSSVV